MYEITFPEIDVEAMKKLMAFDDSVRESVKNMSIEKRKLAHRYADELAKVNTLPITEEGYQRFVDIRANATKDGVYEEAKYLYHSMLFGWGIFPSWTPD